MQFGECVFRWLKKGLWIVAALIMIITGTIFEPWVAAIASVVVLTICCCPFLSVMTCKCITSTFEKILDLVASVGVGCTAAVLFTKNKTCSLPHEGYKTVNCADMNTVLIITITLSFSSLLIQLLDFLHFMCVKRNEENHAYATLFND